jgi:uncharacterized protein (TIGR02246 family)
VEGLDSIRDTLARYAQAHDDDNADDVALLFAEDGSLAVISGAQPQGRAAVHAFLLETYRRRRAQRRRTKHVYANSVIEVTGTQATAKTDVIAYDSIDGGPWTINMIGHCLDQLVRRDGRWLFRERRVVAG